MAATGLFFFAGTPAQTYDDAFITLVYARHLATAGTFYWNRADGAVDGFTSLLDVLLKAAALRWVSRDGMAVAWWLEAAWQVVTVLLPFAAVLAWRRRRDAWVVATLAGLAAASSPALAFGGAFLLETTLFVAVVTAAAAVALLCPPRRPPAVAGWCLLLVGVVLARPEGLVLAAGLVVAWGIRLPRPRPRRTIVAVAAATAGFVVLYMAWRLAEFGTWAPNTYYAKTSDRRWWEVRDGLAYLLDYGRAHPGPAWAAVVAAVLLAAGLGVARWWPPGGRRRTASYLALGLAMVVMVIWAGGDCYGNGRFLALPSVLLVWALAMATLDARGALRLAATAGLVALIVAQALPGEAHLSLRESLASSAPVDDARFACDARAVHLVDDVLDGGAVAESDYQRYKYFADRARVWDLHGLNQSRFAHLPWAAPVRFGKFRLASGLEADAPVWFYGHQAWTRRQPLAALSVRRLLGDPAIWPHFVAVPASPKEAAAMAARYRTASWPLCGRYLNFLARADWAARFERRGVLVGPPPGAPDPARAPEGPGRIRRPTS